MTVDDALAWAERPKDEQALESLRYGEHIGWIELSEQALPVLAAEVRRLHAQLDSTRADLHLTLKTAATQQDEIDALRQRHAEAVEGAFIEGWRLATGNSEAAAHGAMNAAWLASEAKARLR